MANQLYCHHGVKIILVAVWLSKLVVNRGTVRAVEVVNQKFKFASWGSGTP